MAIKYRPTSRPETLARAREEVESITQNYPKGLDAHKKPSSIYLSYVRTNNQQGQRVRRIDASHLVGHILVLNRA